MRTLLWLGVVWAATTYAGSVKDTPFLQDVAVRIASGPGVTGATLRKLAITEDGIVYVLTSAGVARVYDHRLELDRSFRPLAGRKALDLCQAGGRLYYLYEGRWLSNDDAGKPQGLLPGPGFTRFAANSQGAILAIGPEGRLFDSRGTQSLALPEGLDRERCQLAANGDRFFLFDSRSIWRWDGRWERMHEGKNLTCAAFREGKLLIGTTNGYYGIEAASGKPSTPLQTRLPVPAITCLRAVSDGLWVGTSRGLFFQRTRPAAGLALPDGPHGIRYYASKRWLADDAVVDLALDPEGHLWVLTQTGLNQIEFRPMTLAQKAEHFERQIRERHIRFGFSAERRLPVAGDLASSELIDTDNDGGWSSYYLASQAFRYAVTGEEKARRNAWETFAALERLQSIHNLDGFPARTFERKGFRYSDPDRWAFSPEEGWEWKHTTSSDEIASHTFAYAALYECVARTDEEKSRIARCFERILRHIVRNNYYLIDLDGKPTLWGRWNPDYLNRYPHTIFDRRLNSAEIVASLQLGHRLTGDSLFKDKAEELLGKFGYRENIASSMRLLAPTKGFFHQGIEMGDEWNHSDDELAFVTYWVLYRFAFNDDLRRLYAAAIQDHWELERPEQSPFWNFVYAGCGGRDCDTPGAVWTLRGFPWETITWRIENSHRRDLTRRPDNFSKQELEELLPPGERQITRCNTQPFILDGGDGGHTEFSGEEYLIGYWLGRYLKEIEN